MKNQITITLEVNKLNYLPSKTPTVVNMAVLNLLNAQYINTGALFLTPSNYLIPFSLTIYKRDVNDVLNLVKLYTNKFQLTVSNNGGCDCVIEGYCSFEHKASMMKSNLLNGNQHHINTTLENPTQVFKTFRRINAPFRNRGNFNIYQKTMQEKLKSFKKNKEGYIKYNFKHLANG